MKKQVFEDEVLFHILYGKVNIVFPQCCLKQVILLSDCVKEI